ncbi:hypothetical protein ACFQ1R_11710 [Mariniflexile jejuense]|uniref:Transmembrane protein n=1 Tax=Mariniflexile jejuense TaxID=1173582 RepID=A0ABW3JKF1_9FLAO
MNTKLIFLSTSWSNRSNKYYISFYKNKINTYKGIRPLQEGKGYENKLDYEVLINSTFEIEKIDKLDRNQLKTNATHKITCLKLHEKIVGTLPYCIKLNWFQEFYINWHKQKYIVQSLDFKKNILAGIFGALFGMFITMVFQNNQSTIIEPIAPPQQEIKKALDRTNDQINEKKLKTDSINIQQ